jgi:hypothetical protein
MPPATSLKPAEFPFCLNIANEFPRGQRISTVEAADFKQALLIEPAIQNYKEGLRRYDDSIDHPLN